MQSKTPRETTLSTGDRAVVPTPPVRDTIRPFAFLRPRTLDEALNHLAESEDVLPVAGGTLITLQLRQDLIRPRALVSLRDLPELAGLDASEEGLRIGAMCTLYQLERSPLVQQRWPLLAEACRHGPIGLRSRSTIGGTLGRTDGASELLPVLAVLEAVVTLAGSGGARSVPVTSLLAGDPQTSRRHGELMTEVRIPTPPGGSAGAYLKFSNPLSHRVDVGVSAWLRVDDRGNTSEARIAVGGVMPGPWRVAVAEERLLGRPLTEPLMEEAAELAHAQADPPEDMHASAWYRRELIRVLVRRALQSVAARLEGVQG